MENTPDILQWPFSPATILKKKELSGPRILKEESFGVVWGFGLVSNISGGGGGGQGGGWGGLDYGLGYSPNNISGLNIESSPIIGRFNMIQ